MARHEADSPVTPDLPGTVDSPVTPDSLVTQALPGTPASQVHAESRGLRLSLDTALSEDPSSAGQARRDLQHHEFPSVERDSHRVGPSTAPSTALPMEIAPDVAVGIGIEIAIATMIAAAADG